MNDPKPKRRIHLPPLTVGEKYDGWIGFIDGEPHLWSDPDYYGGVPKAEVFATRTDALKCYEDVRRITILVDKRQR